MNPGARRELRGAVPVICYDDDLEGLELASAGHQGTNEIGVAAYLYFTTPRRPPVHRDRERPPGVSAHFETFPSRRGTWPARYRSAGACTAGAGSAAAQLTPAASPEAVALTLAGQF
jgi:hypothetical protein